MLSGLSSNGIIAIEEGMLTKDMKESVSKEYIISTLEEQEIEKELMDYIRTWSKKELLRLYHAKEWHHEGNGKERIWKTIFYAFDLDEAREHMRNGTVPESPSGLAPMTLGQLRKKHPDIWINVYRGTDLDLVTDDDWVDASLDAPIYGYEIMTEDELMERFNDPYGIGYDDREIIALTEPDYDDEEE